MALPRWSVRVGALPKAAIMSHVPMMMSKTADSTMRTMTMVTPMGRFMRGE